MPNNIDDTEIRKLTPEDAGFPYLIRQLDYYLPPSQRCKRLFVRGRLPSWGRESVARNDRSTEMKFLCVVGARRHTSYGREACERLIEGLAGYNICIVSGLALGIDGIAHEAALRAGLPTIAFPGSGLDPDVLYPAKNHRLADRIIEAGGALLSEFDMDFRAADWSFPQRNRLMAGISHATLVIEARLASGTLITSRLAGDYDREVMAVPGPIFSPLSEGPNMLISKSIAGTVCSSEDILYQLGIEPKKADTENTKEEAGSRGKDSNDPEDADERAVLDILIEPVEKNLLIREIHSSLGKSISETNALLSLMEISGLIAEEGGLIRSFKK